MTTLLAATSTQPDGVNLLPFIVVILALAAAAAFLYLRRRGN
jgi:hypothetical protein